MFRIYPKKCNNKPPTVIFSTATALWSFNVSPLTFGSVQFVSCALAPACRVDVGGVGIHPEVVAVGVAVKMEPQPVTTDLDDVMKHERKTKEEGNTGLNSLAYKAVCE